MTKILFPALAGVFLLNSSCTPYQAQGAGVGALGGAAIGAIAGNDHRDVLRGAAIGAAVGTGVAAAQENERRRNQPDPYYNRDQGQEYDREYDRRSEPAPRRQDYPVGQRTQNPDHVISPYSPYNVIDVAGFRSGALARDPSNNKIFVVP